MDWKISPTLDIIENRLDKKGLPIETSQYDVENLNKIKKIK